MLIPSVPEVPASRRAFWFLLWALLRAWAVFCPRLMIWAPDGSAYLERWSIWPGKFLHRFHQSDPDRGWHCHPYIWSSSRILRGSYVEVRPLRVGPGGLFRRAYVGAEVPSRFERITVHVTGSRNYIPASVFHVVYLRGPGPVWTLFSYGPKHGRSWGFLDAAGKFRPPADREGLDRNGRM